MIMSEREFEKMLDKVREIISSATRNLTAREAANAVENLLAELDIAWQALVADADKEVDE